ncbi:SpdD protein [Streptomyces sp. NPDC047869]|uniref:SpdD protein n=1 Tax=Streptomyces sp. NPDC047869 TaxID=3154709 RepID=UPI003453746C
MFLPKYPDNPTPPPVHTHGAVRHQPSVREHRCPEVQPPQWTDPAPARRSMQSIPIDQKTVVAVVVAGVVLTAFLAAVAVTAISVAIAAVVLRSLLHEHNRR